MHYYIGLPEWRHPDWYAEGKNPKEPLKIYSQHFSSVEGNTTFYALPSAANVEAWNESVPDSFRFCFKFPKTISHDSLLRHCSIEVTEFFDRMAPLTPKLGVMWLQMSKAFQPQHLPVLKTFLEGLPKDFSYGIEVRHHGFFRKDDTEKAFNQLLMEHQINRVMFDTRVLFANPANDESSQDALNKKPRLPLHVIATGDHPMLRFISPMDMHLSDTAMDQWARKTIQWIDEGKTPYLFFHTPNKAPVPQLALDFSKKVSLLRPEICPITLWDKQPQQASIF